MLELLKKKNPNIEVYSVEDAEFASYGRILDIDLSDIIEAAKKIENPEAGVRYVASEESFECLEGAVKMQRDLYGTLPAQTGYCWGYNSLLNASEWHTSSEINTAVTPLVLILGHVWDIKDGKIDSSSFKAFYVPEGVTVEVYATTLHYTPCQVNDGGFGCVVGLPKGTNTALEERPECKYITAKNKWIICHVDNEAAKARGYTPGISGENFKINY